jgi:hypothetical protein
VLYTKLIKTADYFAAYKKNRFKGLKGGVPRGSSRVCFRRNLIKY